MSLYFFINHVVRRYVAKNNRSKVNFPELSSMDESERAIIKDTLIDHSLDLDIHETDRSICIKISSEINKESYKTDRTDYQKILFNELRHINKRLTNECVKGSGKLTWNNTRYLFLLVKAYSHNENPVILLNILMRDQAFFRLSIKRIVDYPMFRDWITLRNYITNFKSNIIDTSYDTPFYMTELYTIFLMELHQSSMIRLVASKVNMKSLPKRQLSIR